MPSKKIFENDSFNRRVVAKLADYRDRLQQDETSVWKQISLDLSNEEWMLDCSDLRWQDLSTYFKRSLVFRLSHRKFTDDQGLIDRLQYPYLRKVYVVTIQFYERVQSNGEPGRSGNSGEMEDNRLFIKYSLDGRYDPDVVAAFRRRSRRGKRIYVNINVADPAYNLPGDVKKLLLQIEHRRRERPNRHPEGNRDERESSPVVLDGVALPIEDGSPREKEFSARDLLEKESFSVNTQEYDNIIKESLERELSPVPKRRRVDSFDPHSVEVWLESNEILSASLSSVAATGGHQEDPLHMSGRSGTHELDLSERIAAESSVSEPLFTPSSGEVGQSSSGHPVMEVVTSQPPTLIMASQPNGASMAAADPSQELVRIKQESVKEEISEDSSDDLPPDFFADHLSDIETDDEAAVVPRITPISAVRRCSLKSDSTLPSDFFDDHLSDIEADSSELGAAEVPRVATVEPTIVNNDFLANVTSDLHARVESKAVAKDTAAAEELPISPKDVDYASSRKSSTTDNSSNLTVIENRDADSISPGSVDQGTSVPVPNRTAVGIVKCQHESVQSKQVLEKDNPNLKELVFPVDAFGDHLSIQISEDSSEDLPPDFFGDHLSELSDDSVASKAAEESRSTRALAGNQSSSRNSSRTSTEPVAPSINREDKASENLSSSKSAEKCAGVVQCEPEPVQITQNGVERDNPNPEDSDLPEDFFGDHLSDCADGPPDDSVASKAAQASRSTRALAENQSSSRNSSRTSPEPVAPCEDRENEASNNNSSSKSVEKCVGVVKCQPETVQIKQEGVEKDNPNLEDSNLPEDFFSDHSSDCEDGPSDDTVTSKTVEDSRSTRALTGNQSSSRNSSQISQEPVAPSIDREDEGSENHSSSKSAEKFVGVVICQPESVQITQGGVEKDNPNVENSDLPEDFFSDHSSDCEDGPPDDSVASKAAEESRSSRALAGNQTSSRNSSRTSPGPVAPSEDREDEASENIIGTSRSAEIQCRLPVVHQLATKRISILNDSVSGTPLFNNSLESVPLHYIMTKRPRLRIPLGDVDQNVLLSAADAVYYQVALDHDQSVCRSESLELSADVDSMASVTDSPDQLLKPVMEDLDNSTEIVDQPPLMQRFDISLHLESQPQNHQIYMRDLHNANAPTVSVVNVKNQPDPENRNHATTANRSSDSNRLLVSFDSCTTQITRESPPMATSPTANASNFEQRHESLKPTIESRLRFLAVLRTCWPELFSKTGTFDDFYEFLSSLARNLFPRIRPTSCNQAMTCLPMFSAIACQVAFGTCLQTGPQQSTRIVVDDANLRASQHSDGYCDGVIDRQINDCTAEIEAESSLEVKISGSTPAVPVIIEVSDDSDPGDLPVRKKRHYRVRQRPKKNVNSPESIK